MSDELMIQPGVNPQIQPQRVNALPYALGGAVVGGAGAYGATSLLKKAPKIESHDDLVNEANKNDKVDLTEYNAKKKALDEAEAKVAEASKPVYDGKEKEALDKAIEARDKELARLTETKTSASKFFEAKDWKKLKIDATELPAVNERTGKPFTTKKGAAVWEKEVENEYNRLKAEYDKAVRNMNTRLGSGDEAKLSQYKVDIQKYLDDTYNANKGVKPKKLDKLFSTETGWGSHTSEYYRAQNLAKSIIPSVGKDPTKLTDAQVQSFAERLEKGATTPSGYRSRTVFEVVEGKRTPVKYAFSSDMFNEFRSSENAKIAEQRNELIDSLLNRAKENIGLQKKQASFDRDFIEMIPDDTAKKTGLYTTSGSRKEVEITKIKAEAGRYPSFYDSDLSKVSKAIEMNGAASTKLPTGLKGNYSGATDLQQLEDMIQSRKDVLKMYNQEQRALSSDLRNCLDDHAVLKQLREKIEDARNSDEAVSKAKENILKQFPSLEESAEKVGLTEAEAKEKDSYKKLAKAVEDAQAKYDKAAADKGKVNESAKKTAEENLNKVKEEYNKIFNEVKGKFGGMSGKAKAAWAAGTAIVGAGIGALIVNNKNKKIEAEAQQNIYA